MADDIRSKVTQYANKYGIPPKLFTGMIRQESGFRPDAVSSAGAQGLGQLMPGTAKNLGVKDPFNPDQNLDGSARYLKQQHDQFGSWDLALAAYNAGPGAVQKYGGIPPYKETQNYVKSIMASAGADSVTNPKPRTIGTVEGSRPKTMGSNETIDWQDQDSVDKLRKGSGLPPKEKLIGDMEEFGPSSNGTQQPPVSSPNGGTVQPAAAPVEGISMYAPPRPQSQPAVVPAKPPEQQNKPANVQGTPTQGPVPAAPPPRSPEASSDLLSGLGILHTPSPVAPAPAAGSLGAEHPSPGLAAGSDPLTEESKRVSLSATGPLSQAIREYAQRTGGRDYVKDLVIHYASAPLTAKESVLREADSYGLRQVVQSLASRYGSQLSGSTGAPVLV